MNEETLIAALRKLTQKVEGEEKVNWTKKKIDITREGNRIILPEGMDYSDAVSVLKKKSMEENTIVRVFEFIDAFPTEAAVAFYQAMRDIYDWPISVPHETFFGPEPPQTMPIQVSLDEYQQVPVGDFYLPGINVEISAHPYIRGDQAGFLIHAEVCQKDRDFILLLAKRTREILRDNSIYKNAALRIHSTSDGDLDVNTPPTFIDLKNVDETKLVLNSDTQYEVDVNIFSPITRYDMARKKKISLNRKILLHGPYGTGKTMLSTVIGKVGIDHGWTFIVIKDVRMLKSALEFSLRYQRAIVFCEDIDLGFSKDSRSLAENEILNTIDGVLNKNGIEVMVVMTTNHVERLPPVLVRFGRLDAVIRIGEPDAESVKRLLIQYSGDMLQEGSDLTEVSELMKGQVASSVHEVVKRAYHAMTWLNRKKFNGVDLVIAAKSMQAQLDLMNPKIETESDGDVLAKTLHKVVHSGNGYATK